jgi:hypothetical protein
MKKVLLFSLFLTVGAAFITSCNKCRECQYSYKEDFNEDGSYDDEETITKTDEKCANSTDDLDDFEQDFEQEVSDKDSTGSLIVSQLECNAG